MQEWIDLIYERVMLNFQGTILLWSGAIVDIPDGWALCDGNNGTPDLTDRFVQGAGGTKNPGDTGGSGSHTHDFSAGSHRHSIDDGAEIAAGEDFDDQTELEVVTGTTDAGLNIPSYYALAYIMRL